MFGWLVGGLIGGLIGWSVVCCVVLRVDVCACVDVHRKVEKKKSSISFDFQNVFDMLHNMIRKRSLILCDRDRDRWIEREKEIN